MLKQGLRLPSFCFSRSKLTVRERTESFHCSPSKVLPRFSARQKRNKKVDEKIYPSSAVQLWDEKLESQLMRLNPKSHHQVYLITESFNSFVTGSDVVSGNLHATPPKATRTTRNLSGGPLNHWPQQSLPDRSDVDLWKDEKKTYSRC